MPEKNRTFLLVGHCGADAWSLTRAIEQAVGGGAVIETINSQRDLEAHANADAVLLVNRVSQAVQAGARPGFGKNALNDPATSDLLKRLAGGE